MDGQKIAVILAVISLIYIIAKLCADTPSEPSVFDSFYEESQDETSAHEDSSSKVKWTIVNKVDRRREKNQKRSSN